VRKGDAALQLSGASPPAFHGRSQRSNSSSAQVKRKPTARHDEADKHRVDRHQLPGVPDHVADAAFARRSSRDRNEDEAEAGAELHPGMIKGAAPGSAIVRKVCHRPAPRIAADIEVDAVDFGERRQSCCMIIG